MLATKLSIFSSAPSSHHSPNSPSITFSLPSYHHNNNKHSHFPSLHLSVSSTRRNFPIFASSPSTILSTKTSRISLENLPPAHDATSLDPPTLFDGTTRLYISYTCPYAQRVWITRNCKGLEEEIKLVPINLKNRPAWYKHKVYPPGKVPSLEHNNEVKGESLDLIKYVDSQFEGPSLSPNDPARKVFGDVLLSYTDSFQKSVTSSFAQSGVNAETGAAFDFMEEALSKFDEGPFFLGQFSLVDIAYVPFLDRYNAFLLEVKNYDLTAGRPKLAAWFQEMNKIEGYKKTQLDPQLLIESYKRRFLSQV